MEEKFLKSMLQSKRYLKTCLENLEQRVSKLKEHVDDCKVGVKLSLSTISYIVIFFRQKFQYFLPQLIEFELDNQFNYFFILF